MSGAPQPTGPLPAGRGRHRLTPEQVAAAQSARMLDAIIAVAGSKGYAATTVADVTAAAGVSRRTFYEQFSDKEDCFMAAVHAATSMLTSSMAEIALGAGDWLDRVRASVDTYLNAYVESPELARALLLELMAAGPRGLEHRAQVHHAFTTLYVRLYDTARLTEPELPAVPPAAFRLAVGGFDEVLTELVRQGRFDELPKLTSVAVYQARSILAGHPAAKHEFPADDPLATPPPEGGT